jgi:HSP20 family protein
MEGEATRRDQDALRDMVGLRDTISGLFDDFFTGRPMMAARAPQMDNGFGWSPAVDIRETADAIVVSAALPGVNREDVELEVKDGNLILSGKRKEATEEEGWLRRELPYGQFFRAFKLSAEVQADQVKAHFKNGILEINLPKAEGAKPRKVRIE